MNESPSKRNRFSFAGFTLDIERCTLESGGAEVILRPKSFDVLRCLVEHQGRPLSVDVLRDEVWGNTIVGEDSVRHCIIEIRKALGDPDQRIVRTVPRRGYLFNVPVTESDDGPAPDQVHTPRRTQWVVAGAASVILAIAAAWWLTRPTDSMSQPTPSTSRAADAIAVLRFTDMSPASNQAYLADGLSEEIMHLLAQSPSLTVIARTSSFAVEGEAIDVIAERLGVSHVLEGSVRRQGEQIRVTAQLIDTATSSHIWSRTYDRNVEDIFEVQRDIARAVAGALEVSLADVDGSDIDPGAYQLFLEARYFYLRRADGDRLRAQERFEEALSISPQFARAWAGLAAAVNSRLNDPHTPELSETERADLLQTQRHAVEQALKLSPNLSEAHHRAAQYFFYNGEKARALEHLEIARSIDPDHWLVRTALANELRKLGRIDESISLTRQEVQRDPLNFVLQISLVGQLSWAGRFEDAQAQLNRFFALMPAAVEHSLLLSSSVAKLQILRGDFAAAANSAASLPDGAERWQLLALAYHALGRQSDSDAALAQLSSPADNARAALFAAEVHAFRGDSAAALDWLWKMEFDQNCGNEFLAQAAYYSPFLARLAGGPAWEEYRSGVFQAMQDCLVGLAIDAV